MKGQAEYDSREPEDEECDHHWISLGVAEDGTAFVKCTKCKEEAEV
jgi:hypothetical protein